MNHGGGRAIGDEPGSIRAELERAEGEKRFGWRRAELERQAAAETPDALDPAFVTAFRREMAVEVAAMQKEAAERGDGPEGPVGGADGQDAEAARQMGRMEREMADLEREIDAASEGTLGEPFARFVRELGTAEGTRRAFTEELSPEEREVRRRALEDRSRLVGAPASVLDAVFTLESAIRGFTLHQRRQALAHALWRSLSSMNESGELWTESVTLRDGGRKVSFELSALWKTEG